MATSVDRYSHAEPASAEGEDGLLSLLNQTADGVGHLVAKHIRLVHLEIVADAKRLAWEAVFVALSAFVVVLGYAMLWLGIALLLAKMMSLASALLLSGGLHLGGGSVALTWAIARVRKPSTMRHTSDEVTRSLVALSAPEDTTLTSAGVQ